MLQTIGTDEEQSPRSALSRLLLSSWQSGSTPGRRPGYSSSSGSAVCRDPRFGPRWVPIGRGRVSDVPARGLDGHTNAATSAGLVGSDASFDLVAAGLAEPAAAVRERNDVVVLPGSAAVALCTTADWVTRALSFRIGSIGQFSPEEGGR